MGDVAAYMKNEKLTINEIKLTPQELAELIASIKDGTISGKIGKEVLVFSSSGLVLQFYSFLRSIEFADIVWASSQGWYCEGTDRSKRFSSGKLFSLLPESIRYNYFQLFRYVDVILSNSLSVCAFKLLWQLFKQDMWWSLTWSDWLFLK